MKPAPSSAPRATCKHTPPCPPADAPDHGAARVTAFVAVQGYALLCNGVVRTEDTGEVLPDGQVVPPYLIPAGGRPGSPQPADHT
ncbi:DUF5999 family protein [Streptomyces californicus]|uniref:DUF5999 family protein n=1 Tax=Streptomyces californicus TaxID=67351 RepID=UPI0033DC5351